MLVVHWHMSFGRSFQWKERIGSRSLMLPVIPTIYNDGLYYYGYNDSYAMCAMTVYTIPFKDYKATQV